MANKKPGKKRIWPAIIFIVLILGCVAVGGSLGVVLGSLKNAPRLEDLAYNPSITTKVYDINGNQIAKFHAGENRIPVPISKIPQYLQDAIVAVEDDGFYTHHGVDPIAIARAILIDIKQGEKAQGGSTITQQLIRAAFLTNDKLWTRKIKEAVLAIQLERIYTKEEILELYLNQIYFGHGAYGVEAAAQIYFGKSVVQLDLAESALIAGIANGPGYFSPYYDPDAALRRRGIVLMRMRDVGFITSEQYEEANKEPIKTVGLKGSGKVATYFVSYVREQLIDQFGSSQVYKGGLNVYTTLDLNMQREAESSLLKNLPNSFVDANGLQQPQGALISIDPHTGYIKAMVGGRGEDEYNRATQALRQPGSAFKPLVYATALEQGYSASSIITDEPISFKTSTGTWSPTNYDGRYHGAMSLRTALEQSINTVAIKLCDQVGIDNVIKTARKLGITSLVESGEKNDKNLSLALGGLTRGVTPLELATAYAAIANQGYRIKPISILRVEDRYGNVIFKSKTERDVALSESTAFVLTDMMRGVIDRGTGRQASIGRPAAGKTGTTSDYTNAWFVGFTPDLVTSVWIGNDEQRKPVVAAGVRIGSAKAATIWGIYMRNALRGTAVHNFPVPESVSNDIDNTPGGKDPQPETSDLQPVTSDQQSHQVSEVEEVLVCTESDSLATDACPTESIVTKLYDSVSGQEVDSSGQTIPDTNRPTEPCPLHPGELITP